MRPKVALLAPRIATLVSEPQGGSSVILLEDAEILERAGWTVTICARAADQWSRVTRVPARLGLPLVTSLDYCGHFVAHAGRAVLVAYNEPTVAVLAPGRTVTRFDWPTPLPRYWRLPMARGRFRRAFYLFPSEFLRVLWGRAHPGIPARAMQVVPNGVDTAAFSPVGNRNSHLVVGFAGQWVPEKGLQVLVDAWPTVRRAVPQAELWIAGGPNLWKSTREPPGAADLTRRIHATAIEGLVFVGVLPRCQMADFWSAVSVACVPSLGGETFGLVALEAMACGVPVVYTDRGALPEVVGPGGLVVESSNREKLAEALIRLLIDPDLRQRLGALSRRRAEGFSLERRRRKLLTLLERIWERIVGVRNLRSSDAYAEEDRDGVEAATLDA